MRKLAVLCTMWALLFAGCTQTSTQSLRDNLMGTVMSITAYGENAPAAIDMAYNRIEEIHSICDANSTISLISCVNNGSVQLEQALADPDFFAISKIAMETEGESNGAFNPAIGSLVKLWGISTGSGKIPNVQDIASALEQIEIFNLQKKTPENTFQAEYLVQLDFGAVAKGYACDEAARVLSENGVKSAILDLGGNIYAMGKKPDGKQWRIGLRSPVPGDGGVIATIPLTNMSAVTSGSYERYFESGGRLYHHILDPKTGYPAESGLLSVTIIYHSSGVADAYSTACFVMGLQDGAALVRSRADMAAIFITEDFKIYTIGNVEGLTLTDDRFELGGSI